MDDMPFYADDHFVGIQTHFMKIVALYDNLIILIGNKNKSITKETFIQTYCTSPEMHVNTAQRHSNVCTETSLALSRTKGAVLIFEQTLVLVKLK